MGRGWVIKDIEKDTACFCGGRGIAYRSAVVWTQLYSKVPTEMLEVRSDAAPTSEWPGLSYIKKRTVDLRFLRDAARITSAPSSWRSRSSYFPV